jgi:hypothetical protein
MSEVQTQEQFDANHRSTVKDLRLEKAELDLYAAKNPTSSVFDELTDTLDKILSLVSPEGPLNAETIFRNAIEAMDIVEAKNFMLANLLEGLKRGEKEEQLISRFRTLGLLKKSAQPNVPKVGEHDADVPAEVNKGGSLLKRCGLALAQIAVNALKTIPKWVEIEPSITFVGGVLPSVSLALKGKGMTAHELFEALRAPGRFYPGQ